MKIYKKIQDKTVRAHRLTGIVLAILLPIVVGDRAIAETRTPPPRPFVPQDPVALRTYSDLIRTDFELYIRDIQSYFRCLDEERARAFEEAREVSDAYGKFLEVIGQ